MSWIAALISGYTEGAKAKKLQNAQEQMFEDQRDRLAAALDKLYGGDIAHNLLGDLFKGGNYRNLVDMLTRRLPLTKAERLSGRFFNERAPMLVNEGIENLRGLIPWAKELAETGFPTDTEALKRAGTYRLGTVDFPAIMARLGDQLGGSEVLGALGARSVDFENSIADLDFQAREAAAQRRVAGIPLAAEIEQLPSVFGQKGYGNIGDQGEKFRLRKESVRPGALPPVPTLLDYFPTLASVEQQTANIPIGGFPLPAMGGGGLGSLAGLSPALGNAASDAYGWLSDWWGGGGGGGNNFATGGAGGSNWSNSWYNTGDPGALGNFDLSSSVGWDSASTGSSNIGGSTTALALGSMLMG